MSAPRMMRSSADTSLPDDDVLDNRWLYENHLSVLDVGLFDNNTALGHLYVGWGG